MWHPENRVGLDFKMYAFSYKGFHLFMKMILCERQGEKKDEGK
jgi:hypothetical protein